MKTLEDFAAFCSEHQVRWEFTYRPLSKNYEVLVLGKRFSYKKLSTLMNKLTSAQDGIVTDMKKLRKGVKGFM